MNSHYYPSKFQLSNFFWHHCIRFKNCSYFLLFAMKKWIFFNYSDKINKKKCQLNFGIKINFTFDLRYINVKALSLYKCYKRISWKYITTFVTTFRFLFLHERFFSYPHFIQMYGFILLNGSFRSWKSKRGNFEKFLHLSLHFRFIEPVNISARLLQ